MYFPDRIDDLDIRVKQFFMNCRKAKPEWKDQQYKQIRDVSCNFSTLLKLVEFAKDHLETFLPRNLSIKVNV